MIIKKATPIAQLSIPCDNGNGHRQPVYWPAYLFLSLQDPGVWLLDEEVSDPCVVHGEEIVKTVDAEYGQRVVEDR